MHADQKVDLVRLVGLAVAFAGINDECAVAVAAYPHRLNLHREPFAGRRIAGN